jgi:hypothetical protein
MLGVASSHFVQDRRWKRRRFRLAVSPGPGSEDQQRARCSSVLEPAVLAAVDLDQLPEVLASQARLMEGAPLLARQPQAVGLCVRVPHPHRSRLVLCGQAPASRLGRAAHRYWTYRD